MIRIESSDGWWLIKHQDHARLAAAFAHHWSTDAFPAPEPRKQVLAAVTHHDDAWVARDNEPELTPEKKPSAFTKELVGAYTAFEEIDFYSYLNVRKQATEAHAESNPFAAMLISMHNESLLTNGADLTTLTDEQRDYHAQFIKGQQDRQKELLKEAVEKDSSLSPYANEESCQRAFEFLQACDSFSLIACVGYSDTIALQHQHPNSEGERHTITMEPLGDSKYRIAPFPLDKSEITLKVPAKFVSGKHFESLEDFRAAYASSPVEQFNITLVN
ncbi:MAG: DUF3891 family protein [Verrucomicrobiota bacterium]